MQIPDQYRLNDTTKVITPSLLVYPKLIEKNIQRMVTIAAGTEYLRPHVKTHKMAEIIQMQMYQGIRKFKCATIAEAELLAKCSAQDILLAMQAVGANMVRFFKLMEKYPNIKFSTLVDNSRTLQKFASLAKSRKNSVSLWLDINNGMNRTGIVPEAAALELYKNMASTPNVWVKGLHVYDGHLRNPNRLERKKECDHAFDQVLKLKKNIEDEGLEVPSIVAGGSPTFPFHAQRENVETSPGTTLLWDAGYGGQFTDMNFIAAAVLITRVISKPNKNLLCFDLGHKYIAPEMGFPRVKIFGLEVSQQIAQSEEHLVVECSNADKHEVGDVFYAIPMHICPTVAKYPSVLTVENNEITGSWKVAARNQKLDI